MDPDPDPGRPETYGSTDLIRLRIRIRNTFTFLKFFTLFVIAGIM
jgi:hypothetical protein